MTAFQHGVASGDPLTDRVMLWTRVTTDGDAPVPVDWVIARDAGLTDVVGSGVTEATAEHDWTVHVDAGGLEPDTHYWYGFRALGEDSVIARTRTLPSHTDHLRFAMVSCAKFNAGFFNAYTRIAAREDLSFLLHLGDYAEREALLRRMAETGDSNLVVLSGDVHVSLALELDPNPNDADDTPIGVEFVTPSLTSQNLDDKMGWARRTESVPLEQAVMELLPHWQWCDFDSHGYVVVDVTPERLHAEWWHLDTVLERSPNEELGAAFEVAHNTSRAVRV